MTDSKEDTRDKVLCAKCNKETRTGRAGTITQWIAGCNCDLRPSAEEESPSVEICLDCGKRLNTGRAGSLTQWIFRADCCNCTTTAKKLSVAEKVLAARKAEQTESPHAKSRPGEQFDPDLLGDFISTDRYEPLKHLGSGASGTVFLARDLTLDRKVALKKLRFTSAGTVIDFQQEAQTCSRLKHPNIVAVLDLSADANGVPFMVMEYVNGLTLENCIKTNGPLPTKHALHVVREMCNALAYAHQLGVLHRDVKSSNILLTGEHAFLIDFGIANFKQNSKEAGSFQQSTSGNTIAGSPLYMPPDQGLGSKYDERSEIYSAGCVIFESLTGQTPFAGATALEILSLHANKKPPALSDVNPDTDFPQALEALVAKCLSKNPDARFQSMPELRAAIDDIEFPASVSQQETVTDYFPPTRPMSAEERRRKPLIVAICIVAIAAAIGGMSIRLFEREKRYEGPSPQVDETPKKAEIFDASDRRQIIASAIRKKQTNLTLSSGFVKDDDIKQLAGYDKAVTIDLTCNPITDRGMSYVSAPYLKVLTLSNTDVKTLDFIPKYRNLEVLSLQATEVTDQSLKNLRSLPLLKEIKLQETAVTDKGLEELRQVKTLEKIALNETKVTAEGIARLQKSMPMVLIDPGEAPILLPLNLKRQKAIAERRFQDAYTITTQIMEILEKAQGENAPFVAKYLLARANLAVEMRRPDFEKSDVLKALQISTTIGNDQYKKMALNNLRHIYLSENKIKQASEVQAELCRTIERLDGPDSNELVSLEKQAADELKKKK